MHVLPDTWSVRQFEICKGVLIMIMISIKPAQSVESISLCVRVFEMESN